MNTLPQPKDPHLAEAALKHAHINPAPEKIFDDLAWLAAQVCAAPVAVMTVNDDHGQTLKSQVGLTAQEARNGVAFCAEVLPKSSLYIVRDALLDPRLARDPLVSSGPRLRFFAGLALITSDGTPLGTLSVMDRVPRQLDPQQAYGLEVLARQMVNQLELRTN